MKTKQYEVPAIETAPSALEVYGPAMLCESVEAAKDFLAQRVAAVMKEDPRLKEEDALELERHRIIHYARMWDQGKLAHAIKLFGKEEPPEGGTPTTPEATKE